MPGSQDFKSEAAGRGISPAAINKAFANVTYNKATIRADRGQKSFKLSLSQFMQKRGGQTIISRGKKMKAQNASSLQFDREPLRRPGRPDHRDLGHGNRFRRLHGQGTHAFGRLDAGV